MRVGGFYSELDKRTMYLSVLNKKTNVGVQLLLPAGGRQQLHSGVGLFALLCLPWLQIRSYFAKHCSVLCGTLEGMTRCIVFCDMDYRDIGHDLT